MNQHKNAYTCFYIGETLKKLYGDVKIVVKPNIANNESAKFEEQKKKTQNLQKQTRTKILLELWKLGSGEHCLYDDVLFISQFYY